MKLNDLNNKDRMMFQNIEKIQNDFYKCYLKNSDFYINIFQLPLKAYANRNVHQMLGFSIEQIKRWKHQQMLPRCSMCVKKHYS